MNFAAGHGWLPTSRGCHAHSATNRSHPRPGAEPDIHQRVPDSSAVRPASREPAMTTLGGRPPRGQRPRAPINTLELRTAVAELGSTWPLLFRDHEVADVIDTVDREVLAGNLTDVATLSPQGRRAVPGSADASPIATYVGQRHGHCRAPEGRAGRLRSAVAAGSRRLSRRTGASPVAEPERADHRSRRLSAGCQTIQPTGPAQLPQCGRDSAAKAGL